MCVYNHTFGEKVLMFVVAISLAAVVGVLLVEAYHWYVKPQPTFEINVPAMGMFIEQEWKPIIKEPTTPDCLNRMYAHSVRVL